MRVRDLPKDYADKLISAVKGLRPYMNIRIVEEDYMLYQLGFSRYIPCTIEVEASEEEINCLIEEVSRMEQDAYGFNDCELQNPKTAKRQREFEDRYRKYEIIQGFFGS